MYFFFRFYAYFCALAVLHAGLDFACVCLLNG